MRLITFIKSFFVFVVSEYVAGLLATFMVLAVMGLISDSAYNFHSGKSFIWLKMVPLELFMYPLLYILIKGFSGYYIYLYIYLAWSKNSYDKFRFKQYLHIGIIAFLSILLIWLIGPIRDGQTFDGWLRALTSEAEWFFHPRRHWSLFVYAGFIAALLSPYIYKKLHFFIGK